jgi:gluconolactonase
MFAPPPESAASVFARLPADLDLSASGRGSAWLSDRPYHDARMGSFLEGPAFDRVGRLFCVDIAYGRILGIDSGATVEAFVEYDGAPNGLAIHRDGRLFVTDHKLGLMTVDPATRTVSCLLSGAYGEPFKGLNDLVFAANGDLYFTDQGQSGLDDPSGRVFRLAADGRLDLVLGGIPSPNGLALSGDGRTMFLAVTRANQIWRLPLTPQGRAYKVGVHLNLPGAGGPDGLAIAADDTLYVAMPTLGSVVAFDRCGEPVLRIRSATKGRLLTNLCFGGGDDAELFITDSATGSIQRADAGRNGQTPFSHM